MEKSTPAFMIFVAANFQQTLYQEKHSKHKHNYLPSLPAFVYHVNCHPHTFPYRAQWGTIHQHRASENAAPVPSRNKVVPGVHSLSHINLSGGNRKNMPDKSH